MKKIIIPLFAVFLMHSCNSPKSTEPAQSEPSAEEVTEMTFIHTVFFWLNEGVTDEDRKIFEAGMEKLGTVKTIGKYHIGVPAPSDREVVDDSFDYAWIVHFPDLEAELSYQSDSLHLQFIEKHQHLWEKVIVYDTNVIEQK